VLLAVVLAILVHAVALVVLGKIPFIPGLTDSFEWESRAFNVEQVEVIADPLPDAPEAEEVPTPPEDTASLLTEIEDLLPELRDIEIDVSPDIEEPDVQIKMEKPALAGDQADELLEPVKAPDIETKLEELGTSDRLFKEVPAGRVIVEEGSVSGDIPDPDEFLRDAAERGGGGLSEDGLPEGYTGLGTLLKLGTGDLQKSRAALPSDLMFAYDSAELKSSARLGLMKLALLIDRNPEMFCILEGHSDLFGSEGYNLELSRRRAEAVKSWLVKALRLDGNRIIVRGYGKSKPKVLEGTIEEQAINRRVDILMRRQAPADAPVLVKPARAIPIEGGVVDSEPATPLRAVPVEPELPDAPEEALRAVPVPE
jgi:outer membrane protein OmpA-like peptidoglycan-associated protein